MDKVIAFSSFSIMKKPYGDPVVAGFESLTLSVFQVAEQARGFIARAKVTDNLEHLGNFERDWGAWGAFAVPDYYDGGFTPADETHAHAKHLGRHRECPQFHIFRAAWDCVQTASQMVPGHRLSNTCDVVDQPG